MSENISMTRIIDLPEGNPSMGPMTSIGKSSALSGLSNTYLPMDVHPNPYGMPPPPPGGMLPPQQTHSIDKMHENPVYSPEQFSNMDQRLPQRDIPMNTLQHIQDEQIQPNYIPSPPKITRDYIKEYQTTSDRDILEHEQRKMREKKRSEWLDELQIPILVSLLYFVFQLPIVNTMIFKHFSFLSIYKEDGNFNIIGLTLKCLLFGFVYYSMNKIIDVIGGM